MKKIPVIIDCDPGIDDTIAVLMALNTPSWDVVGLTAVAGNVPVELTAQNAVKISTMAEKEIPVYLGASDPLYRDRRTAELVHGKNGLGDIDFPSAYEVEANESAVEYLIRASKEYGKDLEIIALGPMTNLAQAIMSDPKFAKRIKKLTFMGGAVNGGNATPEAEFNIYADPEAARIVFESGIDNITMVGLDVTDKTLLTEEVMFDWESSSNHALQCAGKLLTKYKRFFDKVGKPGVSMHDPLAVAVAACPELVECRDLYVDVECRSKLCRGKTVADWWGTLKKEPNVSVAMKVNLDAFLTYIKGIMGEYER